MKSKPAGKIDWKNDPKKRELLKEYFSNTHWPKLIELLGASKNAIGAAAKDMGLNRKNFKRGKPWIEESKDKIEALKAKLATVPKGKLREIRSEIQALFPHRSWASIYQYATVTLNVSRPKAESKPKSEPLPPINLEAKVEAEIRSIFGEDIPVPRKLPQMNMDNPQPLVSNGGEFMYIGAPLIGSLTTDDPYADMFKNALRVAEASKVGAVALTDVLYMITQKYGNQRVFKAQPSGVKVDAAKVEAFYPKGVVEDEKFQHIRRRLELGKPFFMALQLRFEHVLDLLRKAFADENGKPLYNGEVLIIFGKQEDELVGFFVNEILRIGTTQARAWAHTKILELTRDWKNSEISAKDKSRILERINDFRELLAVIFLMSNISDESINKAGQAMTAYLIRKYEECIPKSKVISIGDAFLRLNSLSIMTTTDKNKDPSDGMQAERLLDMTASFSKGRNPKLIPNLIIGTGNNPYLDIKFFSYQASEEKGDVRMSMILQLPMCIDAARYRKLIQNRNILKDMITKAVKTSGFESAVVSFKCCDGLQVPVLNIWTSGVLKNPEIFKDPKRIQALVTLNRKKMKEQEKKYKLMYFYKKGCTHTGDNGVVMYDNSNDPDRPILFHHQVEGKFLLNCDAPLLMVMHDGDIIQGFNHAYAKNRHPEAKDAEDMIRKGQKIRRSALSDQEKVKLLFELTVKQTVLAGVYTFEGQTELHMKEMEQHLALFVRIFKRAMKVGISFQGTLALILHIMGNHIKNSAKTIDWFASDAKYVSALLREHLLYYLIDHDLVELKESVRTQVAAPNNGPLGEARGALLIDGKRCFDVVLKHKQGPMKSTQKKGQQRGQDENEVGLQILNNSGDDHRGGVRVNRDILHIKTGCEQAEGSYGRELDFAEPNIFSIVYGVPVGGFSAGPIRIIVLDRGTMCEYAKKPFPIDRNGLFGNALE